MREVTQEEREAAFKEVGYICVHCLLRAATHAHHNPPRGTRDKSKQQIIPLCPVCHEWAHQSTKASVPILKQELHNAKQIWKERHEAQQESSSTDD